jgi:peptidoglycan hydrolase-like protein with peptidoglycan-binding domain
VSRPVRWRALPAALAAGAIAGAVAVVAVRGGAAAAPAAPVPPRLATATVARTNLVTTVLTGGTLGYAATRPVVNLAGGIYTWLPRPGATIQAGGVLYRVDNTPVTLMAGATPAWRPFALGMTDGPDIRQLQANLIAWHFAGGLLTAPTGHYDPTTADAVLRWQVAAGLTATGWIPLGQVIFLPAAIRVGGLTAAPGEAASAGQQPYQATTGQRTVTVPLNPSLPPVSVGENVSIILPSQASTPGTVSAVGPASGGSGQLTVTPGRPQATGTGTNVGVQVSLALQSARDVLAVPVAALLALAGGGYGVEVVTASGTHHLVGVTTGIFAAGQVQVSGPGITAGTRVVVAQ